MGQSRTLEHARLEHEESYYQRASSEVEFGPTRTGTSDETELGPRSEIKQERPVTAAHCAQQEWPAQPYTAHGSPPQMPALLKDRVGRAVERSIAAETARLEDEET